MKRGKKAWFVKKNCGLKDPTLDANLFYENNKNTITVNDNVNKDILNCL